MQVREDAPLPTARPGLPSPVPGEASLRPPAPPRRSLPLRRCTRCRPESSTPLYSPDDGFTCMHLLFCVCAECGLSWCEIHCISEKRQRAWPALSPEGILPSRRVDSLAWMVHSGAFLQTIHPVCPTTVPCPLKTEAFTRILSQIALFLRDLYIFILD